MRHNTKNHNIAFLILLSIGLALSIWKVFYGFGCDHGGYDESFYLTIPYRLIQGDRLFLDEWHLSQMSGFLLLPFVFCYRIIVPDLTGIMLCERFWYILTHTLVVCFAYYRLRKYGWPMVLALISYFLFVPWEIYAHSYNSIGVDLLLLIAAILTTTQYKNAFELVTVGILFACVVLCSPMVALFYFVYLVLFIKKQFTATGRGEGIWGRKSFWCITAGIGVTATAFVLFVLSRASVSEIVHVLPALFSDPDHSSASVFEKLYELRQSISLIFVCCAAIYSILFTIMMSDKKRKEHEIIYFSLSGLLSLFSYVFCWHYLNLVMTPLIFLGTTSYVLGGEKPKQIFRGFFLTGIAYSVAVYLVSNTGFACISMAHSITNIASFVFLIGYAAQIARESKSMRTYLVLGMTGLVLLALFFSQIHIKTTNCFFDDKPRNLTYQIQLGPGKGIYTTTENGNRYNRIYSDIQTLPKGEGKNLLVIAKEPWIYLMRSDLRSATYSAWVVSGGNEERLRMYYRYNPHKIPDYIYVLKDSPLFDSIVFDTMEDYSVSKRIAGYTLVRE